MAQKMNSFYAFKRGHINIGQWLRSGFEASAIFILLFVVFFLTMERSVNVYDEGIVLTAAMRVTAGDVIHRDFYANYGPAEFYFVSWFFKVFGQNVLAERVFDLIVRAGISTVTYYSLVYYSRRWVALVVTAVCVAWLCTVGNHGYPIYPALLLAIGSTLMMTKVLSRNVMVWQPFFAGVLTGLSALFRYDIGFFAFVAHALSTILIVKLARKSLNFVFQDIQKNFTAYVSGAGLPVFLVFLWYFRLGAFDSFLHDVVLFPSQYYARTRGLPFPGLSSFFVGFGFISISIYLPLVICVAVMVGFFLRQVTDFFSYEEVVDSRKCINEKGVLVVFIAFLVALFYLKGMVRVSVEHVQLALLPSIMLLGVLFEIAKKEKILFRGALSVLALFCIVAASLSCYKKLAYNHNLVLNDLAGFIKFSVAPTKKTDQFYHNNLSVGEISTSLFFVADDRSAAVDFINKNSTPGQRIFVGLARHDKVFVNDVSAYFMANRLPSTKWHHFDPGLQTSENIQSEIIVDLEKTKPNYIFIESTWDDVNEPNDSAVSSGVKILDEYILKNYLPAKSFGKISILQRKL